MGSDCFCLQVEPSLLGPIDKDGDITQSPKCYILIKRQDDGLCTEFL
jgi:hypothetical protein